MASIAAQTSNPESRMFGFLVDNTSPVPAGYQRIGHLIIADATNNTPDGYVKGQYPYYMGPDELVDSSMPIIAYTKKDGEGNYLQFNTIGDQVVDGDDGDAGTEAAWIAFKRLTANTAEAFIAAVSSIATLNSDPQDFGSATAAKSWLDNNSCWTNFVVTAETTTTRAPETTTTTEAPVTTTTSSESPVIYEYWYVNECGVSEQGPQTAVVRLWTVNGSPTMVNGATYDLNDGNWSPGNTSNDLLDLGWSNTNRAVVIGMADPQPYHLNCVGLTGATCGGEA